MRWDWETRDNVVVERRRMSITSHSFHHIFGHVQVNVAFVIIPFEVDAAV
jgi:hypothetical protein